MRQGGGVARFAWLVALLVLTSAAVRAQQYSLQTYDRRNGLESQTINCMLQDWRGFIWACAEMGLYRFDGTAFERMGTVQGFDKGEYVTALTSDDRHHWLWVATQSGLRRGDGMQFSPVEPGGQPLVVDVSRAMAVRPDGTLLLVRDNQLMQLSADRQGQWRLQPAFDAARLAAYPELGNINAILLDHDVLWVGCDTALCRIDAQGRVQRFGEAQGVPADGWSGLLIDHQGQLWARSVRHVVVRLAGQASFIARDVPEDDMDVVTEDGNFIVDPQGRVLTRTNHGMARWDGQRWQMLDKRNGLPDIGITAGLFDRDGSLWLGTYGQGIYRWSGYGLVEGWGRSQGLDSVPSWSLLRDRQGTLWLGNELGGSVMRPGAPPQPWPVRSQPPPRQVLSLAQATDGSVWIGLYDRRVLRYDPRSGRTELAAQLPVYIKMLQFDRSGRLWIATVEGIYRIDRPGEPGQLPQRMLPALSTGKQCSDIAEDSHGSLWFACNSGLLRFAHEHWTRLRSEGARIASGFSAVALGHDGSVWLGANEPGILRGRVEGDRLRLQPVRDTWLDSTLAYFVRADHRGWIWVGGGGGVDVFDGGGWTHLSRDDGLLWDETDQNAFWEDADGSVWIGSAIGVSHILKPEAMLAPRHRQVVLTAATHGGQRLRDGATVAGGNRGAPLTLHYAILGDAAGSPPRFHYRLQGSEWIETTARVLNFTALPSGDYRFEIQALDDDRRSHSASTYFRFRIPPPWWLSWWAIVLQVALVLVLVMLAWRWRLRLLLKQNRRLEAMVQQRTAALTEETRELERARAELYEQATHDALTGLYNRKAILERLQVLLDPRQRPAAGLAVALIDADHFKRINDSFGHQAGDAALQAIAEHLRGELREGDLLGRYGGEELLMVLPGLDRDQARQRLQQIQVSASALSHRWRGDAFRVTLSIGMIWLGSEPATLEEVIRRADFALYEAKSQGRDRVVSEARA